MYGSVLLLFPTRKMTTFKPSVISPLSFESKHTGNILFLFAFPPFQHTNFHFLLFITQICISSCAAHKFALPPVQYTNLHFLLFSTQIPSIHKANICLPYRTISGQLVIGTDLCETKMFYFNTKLHRHVYNYRG
jgi:hypothetical protein